MAEDQRKRTLEALERRFAVAKAEIVQQQKKDKRGLNENVNEDFNTNSSTVSSGKLLNSSNITSVDNSAKKGAFIFSGRSKPQDDEENGLTYSQLSTSVHENLLASNAMFSGRRGNVVDKILHELLRNGDSAQKYMQGSRGIKLDNWILLDNFVQGRGLLTDSRNRALKRHSKRSKTHMSVKQQKKCGLFDLPRELHKFDVYMPMHEMWKDHMMQLLRVTGKNQLPQCLLGADLHGAQIIVVECKITSFTGVSGIMIRETAETFGIVTQDDKLRVVPKKASVFVFQVNCWKITLLGDKLASRNLSLLS